MYPVVPPQLKDLPRDMAIAMRCRVCDAQWSESVREMIDVRHMGADYADLLEWKLRCACDGMVRVSWPLEAGLPQPEAPQLSSVPPAAVRMPYPVKAVVKARASGAGPAPLRHPMAAFPH